MTHALTPAVAAALFLLALHGSAAAQCEVEHFLASDGQSVDSYGSAVAVAGDTVLIGAPLRDGPGMSDAGAVYVEVRTAGGWSEVQRLVASDGGPGDSFGQAIAIDGPRAVIGAPRASAAAAGSGAVYVFERASAGWVETAKLIPTGGGASTLFGAAVALDGERILVGAPGEGPAGPGAAFVFERTAAGWSQSAQLVANDAADDDRLGAAVALAGPIALVGAPEDDDLGPGSGSAYIFEPAGAGWAQTDKLLPDVGGFNAQFGRSVSLAGTRALIGAPLADGSSFAEGAAFVFEPIAIGWVQSALLIDPGGAQGDGFGSAVAQSGERLLVGATQNVAAVGFAGYAVLFDRTSAGWLATSRIVASDGQALDDYGSAVALDGELAVVGARFHDDLGGESGAAYAYSFAEIGAGYCTAVPNSSGAPARIVARGSTAVAADCVTLLATDLPQDRFGYFLASMNQGFFQPPLSQGNFCLAVPVGRFVGQIRNSGSAGAMAIEVDLTDIAGLGPVLAGDTWNFQGWFRDQNPGATSNFTDGVEVVFD